MLNIEPDIRVHEIQNLQGSQGAGRWCRGWASCSSRYLARYVANKTRENGAEDAEPPGDR
jgi:hypothetical protein